MSDLGRKRISGRKLVPVILVLVLIVFGVLLALFHWGPRGRFTGDAAGGGVLKGRIEALCMWPGAAEPRNLNQKARCPQEGTVAVTLTDVAPEAKHVVWAIFGPGGVKTRSVDAANGAKAEIPLGKFKPGPMMLVAIVVDGPFEAGPVEKALGSVAVKEGGVPDLAKGLDAIEKQAISELRRAGRKVGFQRQSVYVDEDMSER